MRIDSTIQPLAQVSSGALEFCRAMKISIERGNFGRAVRRLAIASLLLAPLYGCTPTMLVAGTAAHTGWERSGTEYFADASAKLPPIPDGYMRLHIYRFDFVRGMAGRPVVVVNGVLLGDDSGWPFSTVQTRLLPASVFVVDTPSPATLWLRNEGQDDLERKITLTSDKARVWFVKWQVKWFERSRLEAVAEEEAKGEINDLAFTGYVKL